jgi:hypothetical protein
MQEPADRSRGVLARIRALSHLRLVAAAAIATAFAITVIGAGAAPVGPTPLSDVLGVTGEHGAAVSDAVRQAKDGLEDGDKVGPAVSEAACTEAHNPDTLPAGAKAAHEAHKPVKECTHPSNAESDEETSGDEPAATDEAATEDTVDEESNHGQLVSKAVHEAKENLEEGDKVGPAVSEAACTAAHSNAGLPQNAADAHDEHKPAKDCTHPSNATSDEETTSESGGAGHGKSGSAPGRNK